MTALKPALLLAVLALGACAEPGRPGIATDIGLPEVITLPPTTMYIVMRSDLTAMLRLHNANAYTSCVDNAGQRGCTIMLPKLGQATPAEEAVLTHHELGHVAGCDHGPVQRRADGSPYVVWTCP